MDAETKRLFGIILSIVGREHEGQLKKLYELGVADGQLAGLKRAQQLLGSEIAVKEFIG